MHQEGRGSLLSFMSPKPISKALPAGDVLEVSMRGLSVFFWFWFVFNSWLFLVFLPWECGVERGTYWGWLSFCGGLEDSFLPFCCFLGCLEVLTPLGWECGVAGSVLWDEEGRDSQGR